MLYAELNFGRGEIPMLADAGFGYRDDDRRVPINITPKKINLFIDWLSDEKEWIFWYSLATIPGAAVVMLWIGLILKTMD